MNFEKCFDILNQRQTQHELDADNGGVRGEAPAACPCLTALTTEHTCDTITASNEDITKEAMTDYDEISTLQLLEKFSRLQEERVAVYKEFDTSLQSIIEDGRIAEYSLLCAEVTARFQAISKLIIKVQSVCLGREGAAQVGSSIRRLQKCEGEKLLIVAAQHMDIIRHRYPAFAPHMGGGEEEQGSFETNSAYNKQKQLACEEQIREEMENIISEKCDLV